MAILYAIIVQTSESLLFHLIKSINLNNFNILLNRISILLDEGNGCIERKWCETRLMRDSICESIIRLFVSDRGGYTIEPIYPSSDLESLFSRDVNELSSRFLYSPPPPSLLSALVAYLVSVFHLDSLLVNIDVFVSIRETRLDNLLFSWPRVGRIRTG